MLAFPCREIGPRKITRKGTWGCLRRAHRGCCLAWQGGGLRLSRAVETTRAAAVVQARGAWSRGTLTERPLQARRSAGQSE